MWQVRSVIMLSLVCTLGFMLTLVVLARAQNGRTEGSTDLREGPLGIVGRPLRVFDTNGKFVGVYDFNVVYFKMNGRIHSVGLVSRDGFSNGTLWFESSDCSRTPLIYVRSNALIQPATVGTPGSTVYLPDLNNIHQPPVPVGSVWEHGTCSIPDYHGVGFPLASGIPFIDLDTVFTPPFSVR